MRFGGNRRSTLFGNKELGVGVVPRRCTVRPNAFSEFHCVWQDVLQVQYSSVEKESLGQGSFSMTLARARWSADAEHWLGCGVGCRLRGSAFEDGIIKFRRFSLRVIPWIVYRGFDSGGDTNVCGIE